MNISCNNKINNFIDVFERNIIRRTKDMDRIACHLTGGHDSRAILSILLKNKLKVECITGISPEMKIHPNARYDPLIAHNISKKYDLEHHFIRRGGFLGQRTHWYCSSQKFDVVFSGAMMGNYLNKMNLYNLKLTYQRGILYKHINLVYELMKISPNLCYPIIEKEILDCCRNIPLKYKHNSIIQDEIIKRSFPELLDMPFTKSYYTFSWERKTRKKIDLEDEAKVYYDGTIPLN